MSSNAVNTGDLHTEFFGRIPFRKRVDSNKSGGTLGFGAISKFAKKSAKTLAKPKVTKSVGDSGIGTGPFHTGPFHT